MARVFFGDSENYVEVPDASFTLADICGVFGVDPTSSYIRRSNSGAIVATLPTDSLPDFSGSVEFTLVAAATSGGTGAQQHQHGAAADDNDDDDADGFLEHAVLRMVQLVDSTTSGARAVDQSSDEDRAAVASFFDEKRREAQEAAAAEKTAAVDGSSAAEQQQQPQVSLFVSASTDYHPLALHQLLNGMSKKSAATSEKYSFERF